MDAFGAVDELRDVEVDGKRGKDIGFFARNAFGGNEILDHLAGGHAGGFVEVGMETHGDEVRRSLGAGPAQALALADADFDGAFEYSPQVEATIGVPGSHVLSRAYPNPFNPQTNFTLAVRETQAVAITVHDVLGREVVMLFNGNVEGGSTQTFTWQADGLPSGMYMLRVIGESFAETRSVTLLQ